MFRCNPSVGVLPFIPLFFISVGASQNNTTNFLPSDPLNHVDSNLLCGPAEWPDITIFFLGNYVAHAATVLTLPGESPLGAAFVVISALFSPTSGVVRGMKAIFSFAVFAKTNLQRAARAGALSIVVEDSRPRAGREGALFRPSWVNIE